MREARFPEVRETSGAQRCSSGMLISIMLHKHGCPIDDMRDGLSSKAAMTQRELKWFIGSDENSSKGVHRGSVFACVHEFGACVVYIGRICLQHLFTSASIHTLQNFGPSVRSIPVVKCGLGATSANRAAGTNYAQLVWGGWLG